ncbi:HDOD domain-containing protein [Glaciecola sp.]|nr:HDOD domain-containing protein [Glaciecola sp.]
MPFTEYAQFANHTATLPDIALRLREILDDPATDAQAIGHLIGIDPALSAKVLRLANSALFRFPAQIDNIARAVNVVGGEAIYMLVMAETAKKLQSQFTTDLVNPRTHWYKSILTGVLAQRLAKPHIRGSERFFVLGLLYHLGEMVTALRDPEKYSQYINDTRALSPWRKQLHAFGFDFALLSGAIYQQWQLPIQLYAPLMDTHDNAMAHKPIEERLLLQANGIVWLLGEQDLCEQAYITYREELKITIEYKGLIALCEEAQQQAHALQALFS